MDETRTVLTELKNGEITVEEALLRLKKEPFCDIDFAKIDNHRKIRGGVAEIIYGEGKSAEQISNIISAMIADGQKDILITRLDEDKYKKLHDNGLIAYDPVSKTAVVGHDRKPDGLGKIVVAAAGTSDIYCAEEAARTAEFLGNEVTRLYDVGVAGISRLFANIDDIMTASVIIVAAGMEGALVSVIGGLADCPVIALPTSVGYGASFEGVTALLAMMNSCASGVGVVNIDNGFGAGFLASRINHMEKR